MRLGEIELPLHLCPLYSEIAIIIPLKTCFHISLSNSSIIKVLSHMDGFRKIEI